MIKKDTRVDSPCVKICRYNEAFMDGKVCIGCFRERFEITNWLRMSDEEKALALKDGNERREEFKKFDA